MSTKYDLGEPELKWGGDGADIAPRSLKFDDIYFSGDGRAETEHVFLNGNALPARFAQADSFSVGELGFGSGLNFLVTWHSWRKAKRLGARLAYLSIENYPLSTEEMTRAHAAWPEFAELSAIMREKLPPRHPGLHAVSLTDDVTLNLYYGDVDSALGQIEAKIDAWFLDGFSPAKNPAMWTPAVMEKIAKLSVPGATAATFTVAGDVRRGLKSAGFSVQKAQGFGRKRHMTVARIKNPPATYSDHPWFRPPQEELPHSATVAIIGAGVAGACLGAELTRAGYRPTLFDDAIGGGASGNPAAIIMPRLDLGDTPAARFYVSAYLNAVRFYTDLNATSDNSVFFPYAVRQPARDDNERNKFERLAAAKALPADWMRLDDDGLFFPQTGIVYPKAALSALIANIPIVGEKVERLRRRDKDWVMTTPMGDHQFDAVVIANAADALRLFASRTLPLSRTMGQIDHFPDAPAPDHIIASGPYLAPAPNGGAIIGATYHNSAGEAPETTPKATAENIANVAHWQSLKGFSSQPRASFRCVTPDRHPVIGPIPDWAAYGIVYDGLRTGARKDYPAAPYQPGLFVVTGLGSRGFVTAPLAARMIAANLTGAPSPVDRDVAELVHPGRFFIRDLKRSVSIAD